LRRPGSGSPQGDQTVTSYVARLAAPHGWLAMSITSLPGFSWTVV
jgi:hypothetical protein